MSKFKMGHSRFSRFMGGKGFYIALALCLVAIGSASYIAATGAFKTSNVTTGSGASAAVSSTAWDDGAEQTANTVSGVTGSRSSSAASSAVSSASSAASSSSASADTEADETDDTTPSVYVMPVTGETITQYSPSTPVYDQTMDDWRVHDGVDIASDEGAPVKACADGTVLEVKTDSLLGQEVIIQHSGGIQSVYANLTDKVSVKKGDEVQAGTVIGAVGETAQGEISLVPHLHFEMLKNGQPIDPLLTIKGSSTS